MIPQKSYSKNNYWIWSACSEFYLELSYQYIFIWKKEKNVKGWHQTDTHIPADPFSIFIISIFEMQALFSGTTLTHIMWSELVCSV